MWFELDKVEKLFSINFIYMQMSRVSSASSAIQFSDVMMTTHLIQRWLSESAFFSVLLEFRLLHHSAGHLNSVPRNRILPKLTLLSVNCSFAGRFDKIFCLFLSFAPKLNLKPIHLCHAKNVFTVAFVMRVFSIRDQSIQFIYLKCLKRYW